MGLSNFQIVLDSPTNAYYAGTNVTGKITFTLDKPKRVRAVHVNVKGVAKVQWTENESVRQDDGQTRSENITYKAEEEYYSFKYNVAGGGNSELEIPKGDHSYSFAALLPPNVPSSFDGEHGHVRYSVTATLDRPWKFDQTVTTVFTVVTPIDLNFNMKAKEPVKQELEKSFCCCCCSSGPLQLVVVMPYSGFVPGMSVPLTIEVDNASNVQVNNVVIKLNKVLKWKAHEPKNQEKEDIIELSKLSLEGVEQNGSKSWSQLLPIPNVPALNLDQCSIINCGYNITVTAEVGGIHSSLVSDTPVFIGTIPINQPSFNENFPVSTDVKDFSPTAPELPTGPIGFAVGPNGLPNTNLYPTITTPLIDNKGDAGVPA